MAIVGHTHPAPPKHGTHWQQQIGGHIDCGALGRRHDAAIVRAVGRVRSRGVVTR
ncbi:hypothetical protein [Nocardia mangyaensis]|uniref:hypothetical protein n=1 Tax=Nocardia mangyaensis TaxID=2213200 RepID=UPI002677664D|nr:hypothetical protein [Nocardia mangyaensis]MDO3645488.1 hypothetical protein [Nocardia mangyaensis]